MADVFISYSRKDSAIVDTICSLLTENGISYWRDSSNIHDGSQFWGDICDAIRDCKITLFVSSKKSNQSIFTAKEIAFAFNEGKHIIPYRIDRSDFNKKLQVVLCDLNYVDAIPFDIEKARDLVAQISILLLNKPAMHIKRQKHEIIDINGWDEPKSKIAKYIRRKFSDKK